MPITDFIEYCLTFYGQGGIYDMGATHSELLIATGYRLAQCDNQNVQFCGDSLDRESVRDVVFKLRG